MSRFIVDFGSARRDELNNTASQMKLGYVNSHYQLGGAETVVRQLHEGALRAGHASQLFVAFGKTYPRGGGVVPMYPRLLSRLEHSRFAPLVARAAPRYERTDRFFRRLGEAPLDLLHIHNFHGFYASLDSLAEVAARRPVVWTFHRFWGITGGCDHPGECRRYLDACGECPRVMEWPLSGIDHTAEELARKKRLLADAPIHLVAPSQHLARTVAGSPVGRGWALTHIPNGVDPRQFSYARKRDPAFRRSLGLDPDATMVLIVNRNFEDPIKGFPVIEAALQGLAPTGAQFVFAGGGSAWAVRQLPAALACVDLGYVSSRARLADLYEAADIFLYSSPWENFPCVILEAMSARCCVVSTPTDGVVEQVEDGRTGFIADSFSGTDLARALHQALAAPEARARLGAAARERVETAFTEQQMIDRHLRLYDDILRAARRV